MKKWKLEWEPEWRSCDRKGAELEESNNLVCERERECVCVQGIERP